MSFMLVGSTHLTNLSGKSGTEATLKDITCTQLLHQVNNFVVFNPLPYVTVPGKRAHVAHFFKIELLLPKGRVGFELQNALHI